MKIVSKFIAKGISSILSAISVYSVNTACCLVFGQEEEVESLKRLKRDI